MNKLSLPSRSCKFGAPMGQSNQLPENVSAPIKLQMEKLKWIDNDYICDGTYFGGGNGDNIYCAYAYVYSPIDLDFAVKIFVRAENRNEAKEEVRNLVPNARFYN
jgi:hypothetical protein